MGGKSLPHRVLLIDSCQIVRSSLAALLDGGGRFKVVAEADSLGQALRDYQATQPEVVLLGPCYLNGDRIDIVAGLLGHDPGGRIVAVLLHDDDEAIAEAVRMGVLGVVGKTASIDTLQDVLKTVAAKGTAYDHLSDILHVYVKDIGPEAHQKLAPREIRVLRMIAQGKTSKEIANDFGLAVETVRYYRKTIMRKLNVHNVASLLHVAAAADLISHLQAARG